MNTKRLAVLIAIAISAAACAEAAPPAGDLLEPSFAPGGRAYTPGEQQPDVDLTRGTWAIFPPGEGQILAQTFSPSSNQWLGYFELPIGCADGVLLNVKVRDGMGGAVLYEANVAGLPAIVDGTFRLIQVFDPRFRHGIRLHRNQEYAFELSAFPGPDATGTTCGMAKSPVGDTYARGRAFYQDPVNGPDFLPLPNGNTTDEEDLPFVTLVR